MFDESHKLAAHYFGSKLEKTGRFHFAEKLGAQVRHLLVMTAAPHSSKEEDFQLFLSLLDVSLGMYPRLMAKIKIPPSMCLMVPSFRKHRGRDLNSRRNSFRTAKDIRHVVEAGYGFGNRKGFGTAAHDRGKCGNGYGALGVCDLRFFLAFL